MNQIVSKGYNSMVTEKENCWVYSFSMPGADVKDVKITVTPDMKFLKVTGEYKNQYEKEDTGNDKYCRYSYSSMSKFSNTYPLPDGASNKVPTATLTNGILSVYVNKSIPEKTTREASEVPVVVNSPKNF
jgi:HSP20 family molecular chaperone IbpA